MIRTIKILLFADYFMLVSEREENVAHVKVHAE